MARDDLLARIPDAPRWVETIDLLRWPRSSLWVSASRDDFVVWSAEDELGSIVGRPDAAVLKKAAAECEELLAFAENVDHVRAALPHGVGEHATIFLAPSTLPRPKRQGRFVTAAELDEASLPSELREELDDALDDDSPVFAAFDGSRPVAFCYAASSTPTLWDVSIDTIESHRRRGFAQDAFLGLAHHILDTSGRRAVWGAVDSNVASRALAKRLGFEPVSELWVFSSP